MIARTFALALAVMALTPGPPEPVVVPVLEICLLQAYGDRALARTLKQIRLKVICPWTHGA